VAVAADPFLPIYRSFRNAALMHAFGQRSDWNPADPIQDYYFRDERIEQLDAIQEATFDLPVTHAEVPRLRDEIRQRLAAQCQDLIPAVSRISAGTHRELLATALETVADARFKPDMRWFGTKEVWTIEFIRPLARAFPSARFVVLLRDVRAIIASMLALGAVNPASAAQPLSYARHWRKQFAFLRHLERDSIIASRLCAVRYEDLVTNTAATIGELCRFLGIEPEASMIEGGQWKHNPDGDAWHGNSSFDSDLRSISPEQNRHWQHTLANGVRSLLRITCREELAALEYAPWEPEPNDSDFQRALDLLVQSADEAFSWRSDFGDGRTDIHAERARRGMLQAVYDPSMRDIRSNFLLPEAFYALRGAAASEAAEGGLRKDVEMLPWRSVAARSSAISV
jgi:hypothetical protein